MTTELDNIISGATDDSVSTANLLRKVKVVAHRLQAPEVTQWVERELNGYEEKGTLPSYRRDIGVNVSGDFIGPGLKLTAVLDSHGDFPEGVQENLFTVSLHQSIAELEELARSKGEQGIPWQPSHVAVYSHLVREGKVFGEQHLRLLSATRVITNAVVRGTIDSTRNSALDLALQLQSASPDAGSLNGPTVVDAPVASVVNHFTTVNGIANIAIGDHNRITYSIQTGDLLGLLDAARQLGLTVEGTNQLAAAVTAPETERGKKVKGFLRNVGKGGLVVGGGVAGNVIADSLMLLVSQYWGT